MPIYERTESSLKPLEETSFERQNIPEEVLRRIFRDQIDIIDPDLLVIGEEFGDWEDSKRRIDILAVDRNANLVVIELKRTESGGHMELQALRYAAMISTMTFERAGETYREHLEKLEWSGENLLEFLGWDESNEESFAQNIRIILVSANFSKEIATTVLWLNEQGLDIRCIRLQPYADGPRILLYVQQVIHLPQTEEFQIKVREKGQQEKITKRRRGENTKLLVNFSDGHSICEKSAADTFVDSLKYMGLKRILDLDPSDNRLQVVSPGPLKGQGQREVDGLFVATRSSTKAKKECLDHIAKKLGIDIQSSVLSSNEYQLRLGVGRVRVSHSSIALVRETSGVMAAPLHGQLAFEIENLRLLRIAGRSGTPLVAA